MKKVFSILMIIAVLFCFSACSNSSETSGSESSATETSSSRTEQISTTAQETQSVTERTTPATEPEEIEPKSLVVYFSCTGNTKSVAEKIAQLKGADLYEIVPEIPYTDEDLNYNNDNCRANREMNDPSARPAIDSNAVEISAYDTVYIGYPIWWGTMPRIINTFLDTYHCKR